MPISLIILCIIWRNMKLSNDKIIIESNEPAPKLLDRSVELKVKDKDGKDLDVKINDWMDIIINNDDINKLFPESDPTIDIKRLAFGSPIALSDFLATIDRALKEKWGERYRSARNVLLCVKFLTLSKENKLALTSAKQSSETKLGFMNLTTFKCYWNYLNTERFVHNMNATLAILKFNKIF